ncbi:MAG TPA: HAD hydrolase-like protein [Trueperaceae bacterium]|nr:HAD hydrolase-like protein [Trueperaceae bacterium]
MLVLFDIDGTLVRPNGAGRRALLAAGSALFGDAFSVDGLDPSGKLDPAIFEELAARHAHLDLRARASEFAALYLAALRREAHRMRPLPGAAAVLARLAAEPGVALGILTGNVSEVAAMKLAVTGLVRPGGPDPFAVRACGEEAATRPELVALARSRYLDGRGAAAGGRTAAPALLLVGDSPRDVDAGHAHGIPVLAVATGRWSAEALREAGADRVAADLRDPEPLLALARAAGKPT